MSHKHKSENVFKFKKFSDRISEVDLRSSALYRIEHVNELPDEDRSYFYQTYEKWNVLNLTDEYRLFESELRGVTTATLPQLLHHKEKVIHVLLNRLDNSTTLSFQPLLEFVVALSKDLREEFYVYFNQFFERLVKLLQTQDPDQTEWTLITLAYLFKILKPFLCKDISIVVHKIIPLLSDKDQPEHIINFAVECFAFLVRNFKDKDSLILVILKVISQDDSCLMGCGKLFFEMIRGHNGQFHSKGEEFLYTLLDVFRKMEFKKFWDTLKEVMAQTIGDILDYIDMKYISSYWNIIHQSIEKLLHDKMTSQEDKSISIRYILHILGQSIEYRGGKKLHDFTKVTNLVIQIIDADFNEEVMMTLSQIGALLLLSKFFLISQLEASRLSKKLLSTSHVTVFEAFVVNAIGYSQFDVLIMPDFLKYFERNFKKSTMEILAKIISQRTSNELLDASEFVSYNINLRNQNTIDSIMNCILHYKCGEDFEDFLLAIQILPHLMSFDNEKVERHLKKQLRDISKKLKVDGSMKWTFLIAVIASALHCINSSINNAETIEIVNIMLHFTKCDTIAFPSLKILNFLIQTLNKSSLDGQLFDKIHGVLIDNLLSPYHNIRLLTSQILSSFDHLKKAAIVGSDNESIYTIFKRIHEIPSTIQTYRDQVLLLQRLDYDSTYFHDVKDTPYVEDAIKFCMGFMHANFQLLCEPTKNVLDSYSQSFNLDTFWGIFKNQLVASINQKSPTKTQIEALTENEYIELKFTNFYELTEKYDPISYRVKLWQMLSESKTDIQDVKQHDIVELFYEFLKSEYEYEEDSSDDNSKEAPKARQKLLISHLQVLAKFNNPKCVYKSSELRDLYLKFLLHRNFQVQKLALDCVMQYKEAQVANYKEILYRCLDEKTFRQELVALKLSDKIQDEHRSSFIEIFLPIIYSKMTIKASKKDQEGFRNKKEIITRFMSNLQEPELVQLTNIAVEKISTFINEKDTTTMLKAIKNSSSIIKVNELQSMLQFLDLAKKNVAGLFSMEYQRKILTSIIAISCFTINGDTTMFKNLKQSCLSSIVDFFEHFDEFLWIDSEIDVLFEIFVSRYLPAFHHDSSQNISGLMKLFIQWSKNPKYFYLLAKTNPDGDYALKSIINLLKNPSTSNSVSESVMDILERLLTLKKDDEVIDGINYGTELVKPFIQDVLLKLKDHLSDKRLKTLSSRNLLILARVTELVTSIESSKTLLDILFPLTLKKSMEKHQDSDGIMKLLTTISNLLNIINDPTPYMRLVAPLFEQIHEVNHRKFLVKVFNQMCIDVKLKSMINDLNAFDRRWIERPDFEKRLDVFHQLEKSMTSQDLSMDLAVIIIYHCFYFLKYEKDLAMRDNSSHHLKLICHKIIKQCGDNKTQMDFFIDKIILNLIQKRIRDDPSIRTESIQLLGELSREHPSVHPVFADLHSLTDASNRELDFFDNITHLQKFRHMKALRRFVEIAKTYKQVPNLRTLNDFLLPIAKIFMCQEDYQRKSKVIEAAIDFIATICKFLPWNNYEMVLKFYIRKMRNEAGYQKQLIKLIPAILDSFHFDLTAAIKVEPLEAPVDLNQIEPEADELEIETDDDDDDDKPEETEVEQPETQAVTEVTILRTNVAQRVIKSLTRRLIPSLFKIISQMTGDGAHKLNKEMRRSKEKTEMLKIPIALPIIKLLQKLPENFLNDYLSQVVLKVSSFLKSTLKQVRAIARHTLKEILISLGPSHLENIVDNLKGLLSKGFQVHVLSATIHTLMDSLKNQLANEHVTDKLLQTILNICFDDIFGTISDEQEIGKIGRRTPEAKPSRKSFLTLNILAATISEKYILDLLMPFKTQLLETQSKKTVIKIQECLMRIVTGLTSNNKLPVDALMILIHGTISESIPDLLPSIKKKETKSKRIPNDSFIIQEEPKRRGAMVSNKLVKTSKQTNSYVLVEFGLEMLHIMLKKKKCQDGSFLNPLVPLILDALRGNFLRVKMLSVKCITIIWHHQLSLENLKENVEAVTAEIFAILHKYASSEVSRKDYHYLLVKNTFKCVVVLLRHVDYYTVNENQLKALLLYVEQDLYNYDKDTMAFTLLKSILDRKLIVPEIHEILKKVAEICITSELDERRDVTRPIVLTYLMEYPIGKKVENLIKFFIAQLNYEEISGRESAIMMISLIFKNFPLVLLCKFSGLLFLSLGTRLVNDESPLCREKIAEAIELLIKQLDNNSRQQLFDVVLLLMKDAKLVHREMAAQLLIRFANADFEEFKKKLSIVLPLLVQSMNGSFDDGEPGKFVKIKRQKLNDNVAEDTTDERDQQTIEDHHLIQTLNAIIRIFELETKILNDETYRQTIDEIGYKAQFLLSHDHIWVRLRSLKILYFMLTTLDSEIIEKILLDQEVIVKPREFLYNKIELRSVTFDMAVQIKPDVEEDLLKAVMENLVEIAKILKTIPTTGMVNDKKDFNLMWLIRRLRYAIHSEIATSPATCILRKSIFEFFNCLLDVIDSKVLAILASSILTPMMREMVDGEHVIEDLKLVATRVGNKIKSKIGLQEYDKVRMELQSKMLRKRVDRRKSLAQEKINNPAKAATRTILKQLKKQDTKKKKREHIQEGIILPKKKRYMFGTSMNDTYE